MPPTIQSLWSEVKRRRVVRLAMVYILAAWLVIEVATTVFPPLDVPDWVVSLLVVLAILGFPISITLAWAFDLTSEGIKRTARSDAALVAASVEPISAAPGGPPARPSEGVSSAHARGGNGGQAPASPAAAEKSIAVLPFVNMSDDKDNEYFSDGMTEELLNALVRVKDLQVASRTSSFALKGKELDITEVAEKLRVAHVLEGSVRKAGDRIRITAQLIDASKGFHLWSEVYDRELKDVFQVQDEIARAIAEALKVRFGEGERQPLVAHATEDLEAYTHYLKGRFQYNKAGEGDLRAAIDLYRQALRNDPGYARAWAGIADCWMLLADDWLPPNEAYPKAKEAALKALALDPSLSEANTALGKVLGWYEWEFDAGELALRRAVASNPKYADAHWGLASLLPTNGRVDEAVEEMRVAVALDPLSAVMFRWLGRFLLFQRSYEEALHACEHALTLNAGLSHAYLHIGQTHLARGEPERALEAFQKGAATGDLAYFQGFAATALVAAGRPAEARAILERLESEVEGRYVRPEALAMVHGAMGNHDRAFQLLEEAIAARSAGLIYLHVDPSYDPLRADPRFSAVTRRIGLPDAVSGPVLTPAQRI